MKLFVWFSVDKVSYAYHAEGGLVVVAYDEASARKLANAQEDVILPPNAQPDRVYTIADFDDATPEVMVFPNAGCC
jgi:hypothetical protein